MFLLGSLVISTLALCFAIALLTKDRGHVSGKICIAIAIAILLSFYGGLQAWGEFDCIQDEYDAIYYLVNTVVLVVALCLLLNIFSQAVVVSGRGKRE